MTQRFFDKLDLALPDEEVAWRFEYAAGHLDVAEEAVGDDIELLPEDVEAIQRCARDGGPKTRKLALGFLVGNGPCSWDDLEAWASDPDPEIRDPVVSGPIFEPTAGLIRSDRLRWVRLLEEAARRFPDDYQPAFELHRLSVEDPEGLDFAWEAANRLLGVGDPELNTMLIVSYFEHVIPELKWGPEDRHIQPWIAGRDMWRQRILLMVAAYMGLDDGRLRDIVTALTGAKDRDIASAAKGVLEGRVRYGDLYDYDA